METSVQKFFKLNLIMLRILGFYPPRKFKEIYKLYMYAVYVFLTVPVPVLAAVHLIVDENVDLAEIGDNSFIIFEGGCLIFKLLPFIFHADDVRKAIYMLEWPIFNNYGEEEEIIINQAVKICKHNSWLFLGFCAVTVSAWAVAPFFGSAQKFPIQIWLPIEVPVDSKWYVFVYLSIVIGVGNSAISNGVIDPLVSGLACFVAYQLKILKLKLENLSENAEEEADSILRLNNGLSEKDSLKQKIIYFNIRTCICHHIAILQFTQNYEKIFSSVAFTQFVASVIVICVSCLQLSIVQPFTFTFFMMSSFLFTMLLEIFLYCYLGTNLSEESNSLTSAIYMGRWYEYDLKSRKALIVLMERSKLPVVITAGKILDLSLATFTTIIRRAYSLLAVLKNYQVEV